MMRLFPPVDEPYEDLPTVTSDFQARASREGADYNDLALSYLQSLGAQVLQRGGRVDEITVDAVIEATNGARFVVLAHGVFDGQGQPGLRRTCTVRKAGDTGFLLRESAGAPPVLLITSHMPKPQSQGALLLSRHACCLHDVIQHPGDWAGTRRLQHYFSTTDLPVAPLPAPWRARAATALQLPLE